MQAWTVQDCIIGLYYSIDVSGDEALADLEEGKTYTYITRGMEGVGKDSARRVTNSEATLKKVSTKTKMEKIGLLLCDGQPGDRDLHPESGV